jgi:hypothetical protein
VAVPTQGSDSIHKDLTQLYARLTSDDCGSTIGILVVVRQTSWRQMVRWLKDGARVR